MGIFHNWYLYYGRLCTAAAYKRLLEHGAPRTFLTKITPDRWILHAPGRFFELNFADSIGIGREVQTGQTSFRNELEKKTGQVSLLQIHRVLELEHRSEDKARWYGVTEGDLLTLGNLVRVAANGKEDEKPGTYICETCGTTLNWDKDDSTVEYNIRCQ